MTKELQEVAILGLPFDGKSSYRRGAAAAPAAIREALASPSTNLATERGRDLGSESRFHLLDDVRLSEAPFDDIEAAVANHLASGARVISLGGDHSVTQPILRAFARFYDHIHVLHLDAHADLYEEFEGDRDSHACVLARVMEAGLAARLTQVGIRTLNPHQQRQAERYGVETVDMRAWPPAADWPRGQVFDGPVYLSLDLDVLDPAFAPGVSHPEPGGLSVRDVIAIVQNLEAPLIGADIVELNPSLDPAGLTARVAAKLLKEVAEQMLGDHRAE